MTVWRQVIVTHVIIEKRDGQHWSVIEGPIDLRSINQEKTLVFNRF